MVPGPWGSRPGGCAAGPRGRPWPVSLLSCCSRGGRRSGERGPCLCSESGSRRRPPVSDGGEAFFFRRCWSGRPSHRFPLWRATVAWRQSPAEFRAVVVDGVRIQRLPGREARVDAEQEVRGEEQWVLRLQPLRRSRWAAAGERGAVRTPTMRGRSRSALHPTTPPRGTGRRTRHSRSAPVPPVAWREKGAADQSCLPAGVSTPVAAGAIGAVGADISVRQCLFHFRWAFR